MFNIGQSVVCIDGSFGKPLAKPYAMLPVEGETYTVRAVCVGRRVMHPTRPGAANGATRILLEELRNPPDPKHMGHAEMGFNADRFRGLEELVETAVEKRKHKAAR